MANLYVFDILMNNLNDLNAGKTGFVLKICKTTANKIEHLQSLLKNFEFYTELGRLRSFLEVYSSFYALTQNSLLLRENKRLEKALNDNENVSKSISEIYYENSLLAHRIAELEKSLAILKDSKKDPLFAAFVFDFYDKVIRRSDLMKWFVYEGSPDFPGNEKRYLETSGKQAHPG